MHDDAKTERLPAKSIFTSQGQVEQPDNFWNMCGNMKTGANRFAGCFEAGVGSIDIEILRRRHVAGNQRSNSVMNMFASVQDPHHSIQIRQGRIPIQAGFGIQSMNCGATGSDVYAGVTDVEPEPFIEPG